MPSNSLNTVSFHNDSSLLVYNSVQQHQPSIQRPAFDLDEFLKKHLYFTKSKIIYQKDDLVALCLQARLALQQDNSSMSALINIPYLPINIVGDIHGQWRDLLRIFSTLGVPGKARYLFLGDYVDRGKRSLECISLLLALKIKYPKMIYLLRGNHECDYINWNYGFQKDCSERFSLGDAMAVFKAFNELFNYLPLAAIVVDRILCMHGGISPKLTSLDALRKIHLPIKVAHDDQLPLDLLWSDPMPKAFPIQFASFLFNLCCQLFHANYPKMQAAKMFTKNSSFVKMSARRPHRRKSEIHRSIHAVYKSPPHIFSERNKLLNEGFARLYWTIRELQFRLFFRNEDMESNSMEELARIEPPEKPPTLEQLDELTGGRFSARWLKYMYNRFKNECPNGRMRFVEFRRLFGTFMPDRMNDGYLERMFNAFCQQQNSSLLLQSTDQLTFKDLVICLSKLCDENPASNADWTMRLIIGREGQINYQQFEYLAHSFGHNSTRK